MNKRQILLVLLVFCFASFSSGCTYLKNRGHDALDMFDVGVTVSEKPGFSLYLGIAELAALGYSNVEGKFYGFGRNTWGEHEYRQKAIGYVVGGSEQRGLDDYDLSNLDDPIAYGTGIIGLAEGTTKYQNNPALVQAPHEKTRPNCPKSIHLGWVGIDFNCRVWDIFDFILGWTTLDIGDDDLPAITKEP